MLFAIISTDVDNSLPLRKKARPAHVDRLKALAAEERLVLAGPHPEMEEGHSDRGFTGSLVVAEFPSLQAAQNWADQDPYIAAGVYAEVKVKPFIKVLP